MKKHKIQQQVIDKLHDLYIQKLKELQYTNEEITKYPLFVQSNKQ